MGLQIQEKLSRGLKTIYIEMAFSGILNGAWWRSIHTLLPDHTGNFTANHPEPVISTKIILLVFILIGVFTPGTDAIDLNRQVFWSALKTDGDRTSAIAGFALVIAVTTAMVGSLFSSDAWNNITFASDEVINPRRNLPLSLVYGTIIVSALYFMVNIAYLQALPLRGDAGGMTASARGIQFVTEDRVATGAMEGILGERCPGDGPLAWYPLSAATTEIILAVARVLCHGSRRTGKGAGGSIKRRSGKGTSHSEHMDILLCLSRLIVTCLIMLYSPVLLFTCSPSYQSLSCEGNFRNMKGLKTPGYPVLPAVYLVAISS
jgi:APA family basic amino acid/polyamine antiporter